MSKGGSVGSQGATQQARGSFSGNSRPSYGGNQAGGLGSKGGSQSYQEPYRSPYGQGPSYSQHGMRSGFGDFMESPQARPMIRTQGPESLIGQGPSGTYQQFGDFSVGVEGPSITYGTPKPNFVQELVLGDNVVNNSEASMRIGQVAPQQFSGGFGSKGGLMNQAGRGYRSGIGGFF